MHLTKPARAATASSGHSAVTRYLLAVMVAFLAVMGTVVAAAGPGTPSAYAQEEDTDSAKEKSIGDQLADRDVDAETADKIRSGIEDIRNGNVDSDNARSMLDTLGDDSFILQWGEGSQLSEILGEDNLKSLTQDSGFLEQLRGNGARALADQLEAGDIGEAIRDATGVDDLKDRLGSLMHSSQLLGNHSEGDLLASVMYSTVSSKTLDQNKLSLDSLRRYPYNDPSNTTAKFGQLEAPDTDSTNYTAMGSNLADYIEALYKYQWITPVPPETGNVFTPMMNWVKRNFSGNGDGSLADTASRMGVQAGSVFASVYNMVTSGISWLNDVFKSVNIIYLFGLSDDQSSASDNKFTSMVQGALNAMGINAKTVWATQFILFSVLTTILVLMIMWAINRANRTGDITGHRGIKKWGARVMVMLMTVPLAIVFTAIFDDMSVPMEENTADSDETINNEYVVDSLAWAGTTNLSLGPAGVGGFGDKEAYFPTKDAIRSLNEYYRDSGGGAGSTPAEILGRVTSGETTSVNEYFNWIENSGAGGDFKSVASYVPTGTVNTGVGGDDNEARGESGTVKNPYFLSKRNKVNDDSESGDGGSSSSSKSDDKKGDKGKDEDKGSDDKGSDDSSSTDDGKEPSGAGGGARSAAGQTTTDQADDSEANPGDRVIHIAPAMGAAVDFNIDKESEMNALRVSWDRPSTYIYGAVTTGAATKEQTEYANFIDDYAETMQDHDPETGEANKKISDDDKKKAMISNAASIALYNRYAGIQDSVGGGMGSLSTQSTAFLLQSTLSNDTLDYKGFNTVSSSAGAAKNTGINGVQFLRYTIPASGSLDMSSRLAAMSISWITAGIIALTALLALLRSPILLAFINMIKGFFNALFLGKLTGLLTYLTYFAAFRLSFLFVHAAVWLGAHLASSMVELLHLDDFSQKAASWAGSGLNNGTVLGLATAAGGAGRIASVISNGVVFLLSLIVAGLVCWPLMTTTTRSGKVQKLSIISVMVNLPYMLADSLSESINRLGAYVGERPISTRMYSGMDAINQKDQLRGGGSRLRSISSSLGEIGMNAGTGALTGGPAGAAMGAGSALMGKTQQNSEGDATNGSASSAITDNVLRQNAPDEGSVLPMGDIQRGGGEMDDTTATAYNESGQPIDPNTGEPLDDSSTPMAGTVDRDGNDRSPALVDRERGGGEESTTDHATTGSEDTREATVNRMSVDEMRGLMSNPDYINRGVENGRGDDMLSRVESALQYHTNKANSAGLPAEEVTMHAESARGAEMLASRIKDSMKGAAAAGVGGAAGAGIAKSGEVGGLRGDMNKLTSEIKGVRKDIGGLSSKRGGGSDKDQAQPKATASKVDKQSVRTVSPSLPKSLQNSVDGLKAAVKAPADHGESLDKHLKDVANQTRNWSAKRQHESGKPEAKVYKFAKDGQSSGGSSGNSTGGSASTRYGSDRFGQRADERLAARQRQNDQRLQNEITRELRDLRRDVRQGRDK